MMLMKHTENALQPCKYGKEIIIHSTHAKDYLKSQILWITYVYVYTSFIV